MSQSISRCDVIFLTHLGDFGFTEEKIVDCLTAAAVLVWLYEICKIPHRPV